MRYAKSMSRFLDFRTKRILGIEKLTKDDLIALKKLRTKRLELVGKEYNDSIKEARRRTRQVRTERILNSPKYIEQTRLAKIEVDKLEKETERLLEEKAVLEAKLAEEQMAKELEEKKRLAREAKEAKEAKKAKEDSVADKEDKPKKATKKKTSKKKK